MRNKGFTLVELMVVVAIIIILAAILVPRYIDVTRTAKIARCQANQKTLEAANSMYMAEPANTSHAETTNLAGLAPSYVVSMPNCPEAGTYSLSNAYVSCSLTTHQRSF